MKITIKKLDSGHLIKVETEDQTYEHCVGSYHSVVKCIRKYLYKPDSKLGRPKKVKNIEKCLDR